jgi:hypothetical protein
MEPVGFVDEEGFWLRILQRLVVPRFDLRTEVRSASCTDEARIDTHKVSQQRWPEGTR